MSLNHSIEIRSGDRLEFGQNWSRFLSTLTDDKILAAVHSLQLMLRGVTRRKNVPRCWLREWRVLARSKTTWSKGTFLRL